ncbi:MAG: hypothetical protein VB092_00405 [Oscillospiraceae bacterium]|nr:hypothetical protein [Oscillospiraceae bacterium]
MALELGNLFSFKSREQLEKERIEYENKVFPLGVEETRALALEALRPFFRKKADTAEILFPFLTAKQALLDQTSIEDIASKVKKSAFRVDDTQVRAVLALALLDGCTVSLDTYPTAADVEQKMAEIAL